MRFSVCLLAACAAFSTITPAYAFDAAGARALLASRINAWLLSPEVINAIKAQNAQTGGYDQGQIDALDKKWKDGDAAVIDAVMKNNLSAFLRKTLINADGLYTEIIVMDAKGLNVGLSDKTSDAWQGDEAKFTQTFTVGPDAIHLGDVELDDSTQIYSQQLSVTIMDGGVPIGAATIGLNADKLP